MRQKLGEQQSLSVLHDDPVPRHGGTQYPLAPRISPAQQSALDSAAPPWGTQVVRHTWNPLLLLPQYGALEQHGGGVVPVGTVARPHIAPAA